MKKFILFTVFTLFFVINVFGQEAAAAQETSESQTASSQEGASAKSVLFQFIQNPGDCVSHISTVEEEAYVNGKLNNRTQFINRTSTTIKALAPDGDAYIQTHYMTTQNTIINGIENNLTWGEEDTVNIFRKPNGQLYDSDNEYLPTVRCIPYFLETPVEPGQTWQNPGLEVHDCRQLFNMTGPISIPFTATYKYIGEKQINNQILQVIEVKYSFSQKAGNKEKLRGSTYEGASGWAKQTLYWNNLKGELENFNEQFEIKLYDTYKNTYLFRGKSYGKVTEYKSVNDDKTVQKLQETLLNNNLEDVTVKRGEKGLTISLENIQFEPDSNILLPSEKEKLKKIGQIIKDFSNDLLITGHCAHRGSQASRQKLSEERAKAVADYMVELGIRDEYHIFTQGKGSTQPIASNDTEEGRIKNRRVEIILID